MSETTLLYVATCAATVVCACVSTIITYVCGKTKKVSKKDKVSTEVKSDTEPATNDTESNSKTFAEILNEKTVKYMEIAENLFKSVQKCGKSLKEPYVLNQLTMDCIKNGIDMDETAAKEKIQELAEFSKTVNKI